MTSRDATSQTMTSHNAAKRALLMALPGLGLSLPAFALGPVEVSDASTVTTGTLVPSWFDQSNRPTAPVKINGKGPFRLLLDTAATITVLERHAADAVGLVSSGRVSVQSMTGEMELETAVADTMETGVATRKAVHVGILDAKLPARADGVLGADMFAGLRVIFDMRMQTVRVAPSRRRRLFDRSNMRLRGGKIPEVIGRVGSVPVHMVIDTGAECSIANTALAAALRERHPQTPRASNLLIRGLANNEMRGELLLLPDVQIDVVRLMRVSALAVDAPIFRVWDLQDTPALIVGADLLSLMGTVTVDYGSGDFDIRGALLGPGGPAFV